MADSYEVDRSLYDLGQSTILRLIHGEVIMVSNVQPSAVDAEDLRSQIQEKYAEVADSPEKGFHFHTGTPLAKKLGYPDAAVAPLPASAVDSFAGTGNPFQFGDLNPGENVIDVGSGAGFDSLQAARHVGESGHVVGVDMTDSMLRVATEGGVTVGLPTWSSRRV